MGTAVKPSPGDHFLGFRPPAGTALWGCTICRFLSVHGWFPDPAEGGDRAVPAWLSLVLLPLFLVVWPG